MRVLLEARAGERLARVAVPRYKQPQTAPRRDPTVNPFDLFNPTTMPDPSQLTGMAGASTLHEAALFRIATVGFGVDVYTAGMLVNGLRVPRLLGWAAAIAGDLVWFAILLATSLAAAAIVDDDRVVGGVVLVAMLVIPPLARRIFPALRHEPRPAEPAAAATPRSEEHTSELQSRQYLVRRPLL